MRPIRARSAATLTCPVAPSRWTAIGSYAQNAVNLSTFTGSCATLTKGPFKGQTGCTSGIPNFYDAEGPESDACPTTLVSCCSANTIGVPVTLSGGYEWWRQANPSDTYPERLRNHRRLQRAPSTIASTNKVVAKLFTTQWISIKRL